MIQHFIKEKGYSHLRLDGSTQTNKRQSLIDKFQEDDEIFLFLISTKAGGMGLNLTAAVSIHEVKLLYSNYESLIFQTFSTE